jgi:hypothetical protein
LRDQATPKVVVDTAFADSRSSWRSLPLTHMAEVQQSFDVVAALNRIVAGKAVN